MGYIRLISEFDNDVNSDTSFFLGFGYSGILNLDVNFVELLVTEALVQSFCFPL